MTAEGGRILERERLGQKRKGNMLLASKTSVTVGLSLWVRFTAAAPLMDGKKRIFARGCTRAELLARAPTDTLPSINASLFFLTIGTFRERDDERMLAPRADNFPHDTPR
jgi:hypothetical protein